MRVETDSLSQTTTGTPTRQWYAAAKDRSNAELSQTLVRRANTMPQAQYSTVHYSLQELLPL